METFPLLSHNIYSRRKPQGEGEGEGGVLYFCGGGISQGSPLSPKQLSSYTASAFTRDYTPTLSISIFTPYTHMYCTHSHIYMYTNTRTYHTHTHSRIRTHSRIHTLPHTHHTCTTSHTTSHTHTHHTCTHRVWAVPCQEPAEVKLRFGYRQVYNCN